MAALPIHVASVKPSPRRFSLECDREWWDQTREVLRELEVVLHRPFRLDLVGHRIGQRLLFRGELAGAVEFDCSRCLEPYVEEFRESVQLLLEPAPQHAELPESGIELDAEDIELGRYAGDEIDLGPLVLELLALNWPMQPLCDEGCAGLCPVCGVNRNAEACTCTERGASHPFAGLRELLERSGRRER